jgi:GNAT superfamily N-acetyltransferase
MAIQLREFQPGERDRAAFRRLNEEWLRKYFAIEKKDRELFDDPEGQILAGGGAIFLLDRDVEAIGCCALVRLDAQSFEVVKMAVTEGEQGKGYSKILLQACVDRARAVGAKRLFIETASKLKPAITLYRKFGFVEMPAERMPAAVEFARVDVFMELFL